MIVATIDVGTSVAKVGLWSPGAGAPSGLIGLGRAPIATDHPGPDRAEQDPARWIQAVSDAARSAGHHAGSGSPRAAPHADAVVLTGARETFVPVVAGRRTDDAGTSLAPLGPGIVWSDHRAGVEASLIAAHAGGPDAVHRATGGYRLEPGSMVAKLLWLARHDPEILRRAEFVLAPRDYVAAYLTGIIATDVTMASRAGLPAAAALADDAPTAGLVGRPRLAPLLAPVLEATAVLGPLLPGPATALGLPAGIPVVIGAGDRACEALGAGAGPDSPMVAWGTTANLTLPRALRADTASTASTRSDPTGTGQGRSGLPPGAVVVSAGALGGALWECGLSGAGSVLEWLVTLVSATIADLVSAAASAPPGANDVLCQPWLQGARAPWWRRDVAGAFSGIRTTTTTGDMARAVFEGVGDEIRRSLCLVHRAIVEEANAPGGARATVGTVPAGARPAPAEALAGTTFSSLALGAGSDPGHLWPVVVAAMTGLPARRRMSGEAASAGAALVAAHALGLDWDLDALDPAGPGVSPDPEMVAYYASRNAHADAVARAVLALADRHSGPDGLATGMAP